MMRTYPYTRCFDVACSFDKPLPFSYELSGYICPICHVQLYWDDVRGWRASNFPVKEIRLRILLGQSLTLYWTEA